MEKINNEAVEKRGGKGLFSRISSALKGALEKRQKNAVAPLYDVAIFAIALLFSRCHIIFGSYPLALGLISILPSGVWVAVGGAVVGALTLGRGGIVYAIIALIIAFLRIIVSGTDKPHKDGTEARLYGESLPLRLSSAVIGGFIAAVYEVLLNGFELKSILFGVSMIVLPPLVAFVISGLFDAGISPSHIFLSSGEIFSVRRLEKRERYDIIFFQCSAAIGIFLISVSLRQYELFGISFGYIFAALAAIFVGRRFGTLRGAVAGFVGAVGLSSVYSVAFALAGLAVGAFAKLGLVWSVVIGGALLSLWGGYSGGVVGFLSVFPEFAIGGVIAVPLFKKIKLERSEDEIESAEAVAEDMVGTMSLSYKSNYSGALDTLEGSLSEISTLVARERRESATITREDTEGLISACITEYFEREGARIPGAEAAEAIFRAKLDYMTTIVYKNKHITAADIDTPQHLSKMSTSIADAICRALSILERERFSESSRDSSPEDYRIIGKLINEARLRDAREKSKNEHLTEKAKDALHTAGIQGGAALVFGERAPHVIVAFEDAVGTVITSRALQSELSEALSFSLGTPKYYRKGKMALVEFTATPSFAVTAASRGAALGEGPSGDTARHFDTAESRHFSLICDGMGSGEGAARTSRFVADFLERALAFGAGCEAALSLANNLVKRRREECSSSVDLFSFDLISGEAVFYKCGSAPSYIKRGSSLFRIRSKTSPLGLSQSIDAERIRTEVEPGDYIIMFSDGCSSDGEAPWLIELLSREREPSPEALCDMILAEVKKNRAEPDDISVLVTKIERA